MCHRRVRTRRAHGYSGALVTVGDGNAMTMKGAPYLTAIFPDISSVWDYVPHISYLLQAMWRQSNRRMRSER